MDYLNVVVRDKKTNKVIIEHPCPARRGKITLFANLPAAEQSVQLTALRRGLALALLFNVVLLAVVLATIGGN